MSGLRDLVSKAADDLEAGKVEGQEEEVEVPVEEEEGAEEEEEETPEGEGEELDEASLKEAKKLYKSLKDPTKAYGVVSALAGQMGLLQGPKAPETKQEVKEAKKDVKLILKEALGKEYDFLSDRIGNALDAIFEQERETQQAELTKLSNAQVERDSLTAMNELATETKGESRKFEAKMVELSKEILPGPKSTMKSYLKQLYTLASAGKTTTVVKQDLQNKIRRNANDVHGRINGGGGQQALKGFDPNKKYSLKESVALAAKTLEQAGNRK
jgi:hypothetical protein